MDEFKIQESIEAHLARNRELKKLITRKGVALEDRRTIDLHFGADRIIERKIKKVVFGCIDRNPNIRGEGELQLMDAGIEIGKFDSDLLPIIEELNRDFLRIHRTNKTRRTAIETKDTVKAGAVGPNAMRLVTQRTATRSGGYQMKRILVSDTQ